MGVQVPCRVHAEVPQEGAIWANPAAPGHCIPRACLGEGYFVSTIGRNEEMIRAYIRNQEIADKQVPSLVPESFITASGGSPSNPQLCWGLLAPFTRLQKLRIFPVE